MTKYRLAAVLASAAVFASVAPATALAAPALPGPLAGLGDVVGIHGNADNKTAGCRVDWDTSATKTLVDGKVDNKITGGVSPARGDNGVTEMQLWGDFTTPHWRTVVATDGDIANYKLVVKLPAGYTYATVVSNNSNWFAVDQLDNRKAPVKWTHALGSDDLAVASTDGGKAVTITVKNGGTLKALDRFVVEFTGALAGDAPTSATATARSTGSLVACGGNGSLGSS